MLTEQQKKLTLKSKINKFRELRTGKKIKSLTVIKRNRNITQALTLPKVLNLNPKCHEQTGAHKSIY